MKSTVSPWRRRRRTGSHPAFGSILFIFLTTLINNVTSSSIILDWALESPDNPVKGIILQYSPPIGRPPSGTMLDRHISSVIINDTLAATEYTIYITAVLEDGTAHNISTKRLSSSPAPPVFESAETTVTEATISFFPPAHDSGDVSYAIEYHPLTRPEYTNFIETRAPLFKVRGLDPSTTYRMRIHSVYMGIRSDEGIDTTFTTKGDPSTSGDFTVRTLPPNFGSLLSQETVTGGSDDIAAKEPISSREITIKASVESDNRKDVGSEEVAVIPVRSSTAISIVDEEEEKPTTSTATRATFKISSLIDKATVVPLSNRPTLTTTVSTTTTVAPVVTVVPETTVAPGDEIDTDEEMVTTVTSTERATTTTTTIQRNVERVVPMSRPRLISEKDFPEPTQIFLSMTEDKMLRLDWDIPSGTVCDSFLANYTILTLDAPQTLTATSNEQWLQIKMYSDHTIEFKVFCLIAGAASKTWWARRTADLSRPRAIEGLRVVNSTTDEFYVSVITLDIDWPPLHDFALYKLLVTYQDEKKKPVNKRELEVMKEGPIVIEQLEATQWYTISVRNVSVEIDFESTEAKIKELTPPIISSQLYPGQISSTSINMNFDESDPEQGRFDAYELVFSGNAKNITKRLDLNAARSFTFTKLIPGKTYNFELFTVYKNKRSRPVLANVTTYPLKVNKLFPVVGRDYALLFWDIENFADNDCRFRLAYTGTSNSGHQSSSTVVLKNKNNYKFSNLPGDTYYTFTITVIMGLGQSEAESESEMVTVSIGQPPRSSPLVERHGTRELSVKFENDPQVFSEQNGEVDNFAVIVTEKKDLGGDDYDLRSWFEIKEDDVWSAYRASLSDYNPFRSSRKKTATFIIGADDCTQRRLDEPYCNGMLRANIDYYVKIRAYTKEGVALETDWVSVHGSSNEDGEEETKEKRLPCHMYLNGCPRKSATNHSSFFQPLLTLLGFFVPRRRIR